MEDAVSRSIVAKASCKSSSNASADLLPVKPAPQDFRLPLSPFIACVVPAGDVHLVKPSLRDIVHISRHNNNRQKTMHLVLR